MKLNLWDNFSIELENYEFQIQKILMKLVGSFVKPSSSILLLLNVLLETFTMTPLTFNSPKLYLSNIYDQRPQ